MILSNVFKLHNFLELIPNFSKQFYSNVYFVDMQLPRPCSVKRLKGKQLEESPFFQMFLFQSSLNQIFHVVMHGLYDFWSKTIWPTDSCPKDIQPEIYKSNTFGKHQQTLANRNLDNRHFASRRLASRYFAQQTLGN